MGWRMYLRIYFADEFKPKPSIDVLVFLMEEQGLQSADLLLFGTTDIDKQLAAAAGIEYIDLEKDRY